MADERIPSSGIPPALLRFESVAQYLDALRLALSDADPAVAQDALYDTEHHLRSEIIAHSEARTGTASGGGDEVDGGLREAIAAAVERYGAPEEVAAAYLETERTVAAALQPPEPLAATSRAGRYFRVVSNPRAYASLFYMLLAFVTGLVYLGMLLLGAIISLGVPLLVGVPLVLIFLAAVRAVSLVEGRLVESLLTVRMPRRPRSEPVGSWLDRVRAWLGDRRTWTTFVYMAMQFPLGLAYAAGAVVVTGASAILVFGPPIAVLGGNAPAIIVIPVAVALGVFLIVGLLHAAIFIGRLHGQYAKFMLVGAFEVPSARARDDSPNVAPADSAALATADSVD